MNLIGKLQIIYLKFILVESEVAGGLPQTSSEIIHISDKCRLLNE